MKKFALAAIAIAAFGLSNAPASAQRVDPDDEPTIPIPSDFVEECGEGGALEGGRCVSFYVRPPVTTQPPPTTPEEVESETPTTTATTLPDPTTTTTTLADQAPPPGDLPRTGGGVSPILGIGALLFVGGGIIVVASRRRSSAAPSAA